jgi:branched-chain amino acid transport system substrate-binding protein
MTFRSGPSGQLLIGAALAWLALSSASQAQTQEINVGVILSTTGPGSAVGVPTRNALELWPSEIGGRKVKLTVEDDRSDPAAATSIARRMAVDDKVDVLVGSSLVPGCVAIAAVAQETETVQLTLAPIVLSEKTTWSFNLPPLTSRMSSALFEDMTRNKVKTVGYIGFSDVWGDNWFSELKNYAAKSGVQIVAEERFGRGDTSVAGQALHILSAKPDVILVGATSSAAGLVQKTLVDLRYSGKIYHTHGATTKDFLRIAGSAGEGAIAPTGPTTVVEDLPDSHPSKAVAQKFVKAYEDKFGAGTRTPFAGHIFDASLVLEKAFPAALAKAQPGTKEFHAALKQAIEAIRDLAATQAILSYSPTDHNGTDDRARVLVTVKNGSWKFMAGS